MRTAFLFAALGSLAAISAAPQQTADLNPSSADDSAATTAPIWTSLPTPDQKPVAEVFIKDWTRLKVADDWGGANLWGGADVSARFLLTPETDRVSFDVITYAQQGEWPLNAAGEIDEPRASQLPVNKTLTVSLRDAWKTFRGSADRECTLVAPEGGLHKGSTLFELRTDEPYVYPEVSSGTTSKCEPKA